MSDDPSKAKAKEEDLYNNFYEILVELCKKLRKRFSTKKTEYKKAYQSLLEELIVFNKLIDRVRSGLTLPSEELGRSATSEDLNQIVYGTFKTLTEQFFEDFLTLDSDESLQLMREQILGFWSSNIYWAMTDHEVVEKLQTKKDKSAKLSEFQKSFYTQAMDSCHQLDQLLQLVICIKLESGTPLESRFDVTLQENKIDELSKQDIKALKFDKIEAVELKWTMNIKGESKSIEGSITPKDIRVLKKPPELNLKSMKRRLRWSLDLQAPTEATQSLSIRELDEDHRKASKSLSNSFILGGWRVSKKMDTQVVLEPPEYLDCLLPGIDFHLSINSGSRKVLNSFRTALEIHWEIKGRNNTKVQWFHKVCKTSDKKHFTLEIEERAGASEGADKKRLTSADDLFNMWIKLLESSPVNFDPIFADIERCLRDNKDFIIPPRKSATEATPPLKKFNQKSNKNASLTSEETSLCLKLKNIPDQISMPNVAKLISELGIADESDSDDDERFESGGSEPVHGEGLSPQDAVRYAGRELTPEYTNSELPENLRQIPNSGSGLNCLILSVLTALWRTDQTEEILAAANEIRQFVGYSGMLTVDGPGATRVINYIEAAYNRRIQLIEVQPIDGQWQLTGRSHNVGFNDREPIVVSFRNWHFEAIIENSLTTGGTLD
ncbi:hypothetical protein [Vibrio sp. St2]|uniref:hypothetical protein n=1 Tax=Vibrio sp. St2 TaxID=2853441 RepID=UPI00248E82C2|nr:hypothetical protein [Vibrio sp. St2]